MVGTEEPGQGKSSTPTDNVCPKRNCKAAAKRGPAPKRKCDDPETSKAATKRKSKEKKDGSEDIRNRATPFRVASVNDMLIAPQKIALITAGIGGLQHIASSMPVELSQWVMKCYDPIKSELVIPNRGKIPIDAESVSMMWDVSSSGLKVCWDMDIDAIKATHKEFGFEGTAAPELTAWCQMIKDMKGAADDKFVRAYTAIAFSCFFAPTTSVKVCPRSYLVASEPSLLKKTNIAQFVVDQIRQSFMMLNNKKSVCCCVYHMVLKYLDSLEVDEFISDCSPRCNAWDSALISRVIKKDRISHGVFGKLQLKEKYREVNQGGLFGGLLRAEQFVAANVPGSYDPSKKRKLSAMVNGFCADFEESMRKFISGVGNLDEGGSAGSKATGRPAPRQTKRPAKKQRTKEMVEEDVLPEDSSSNESDDDNSDDVELNDDDSEDSRGSKNNDAQEEDSDRGDDDEEQDDGEKDETEEDDHGKGKRDSKDSDKDGGSGRGNGGGEDGDCGGNSAGGGTGGDDNDQDRLSDTRKPGGVTRQYYLRKRKHCNDSLGQGCTSDDQNGSDLSYWDKDVSLLDICRMEKKIESPDIPLLETPIIFDEGSRYHMKKVLSDIATSMTVSGPEQPLLDGMCTPSGYNAWFEESHGLCSRIPKQHGSDLGEQANSISGCSKAEVHKATQVANHAATTAMHATTMPTVASQSHVGAPKQDTKANSPSIQAYKEVSHATGIGIHEGNNGSEASATGLQDLLAKQPGTVMFATNSLVLSAPSPAWAPKFDSTPVQQSFTTVKHGGIAHPTGLANEPLQEQQPMFRKANVITTAASPIANRAKLRLPEKAPTGQHLPKSNYSPPTIHTCPPPSPQTKRKMALSPDEVHEIINKQASLLPSLHNITPSSSVVPVTEAAGKSANNPDSRNYKRILSEGYCDAPSFDLGPEFDMTPIPTPTSTGGPLFDRTPITTPRSKDAPQVIHIIDEDEYDEMVKICTEAETVYKARTVQEDSIDKKFPPNNFQTPMKEAESVVGDCSAGGTNTSTAPQQHARRVIKPPAHMQSPFVDQVSIKHFTCSTEVNRLYALVLLHGRRPTRSQGKKDVSPEIIKFDNYHITLAELAASMKPGGWLHNNVMEIGILYMMKTMPSTLRKVVMPLRISTKMQEVRWDGEEINKLFSKENKLDKQDMIMLPTLQPLIPKAKVVVHHYFLLTINIRDRKYQVLDSMRTIEDKGLKACVHKIIASATCLWADHYKNSKVQIDMFPLEEINVPKQTNNDDCGVCTLMNAELWDGRFEPKYNPKEMPKVRKLITNKWLVSDDNQVNWKAILEQH